VKTGWKLVARLGTFGPGYPHLLVDRHGWCLRLGPNPRVDDKYYSRLLFLLEGLVEHWTRREALTTPILAGIGELRALLLATLRSTMELGTQLEEIVKGSPIRLSGAPGGPDLPLDGSTYPKDLPTPLQAIVGS
jgi:hypothetical protein